MSVGNRNGNGNAFGVSAAASEREKAFFPPLRRMHGFGVLRESLPLERERDLWLDCWHHLIYGGRELEKNYENAPVFFLDASLLRDPRSIIISCPPHYNSSESDDENALYLFLRYALHGHGGSFCCGKPLSVSYIGSFVMLRENPSPFLARAVFQSSVPLRVELEPEFFFVYCVCVCRVGGL